MNEELRELLAHATDRAAVLDALRGARVYVPAQRPSPDASGDMALPVLQRGARRFVPVFTSLDLARTLTQPGTGHAELAMDTLAGSVGPDVWVVVNPTDGSETLLAPGELRTLAGLPPTEARTVPPGTPLRLGEPAAEPPFLPALAERLAALPAVRAAYRALVQMTDAAPRLVVGVDAPPEEMAAVLTAVEAAIAGTGRPGVDVVRVGDGGEVGDWMTANTAPFYTRGRD